MKVNRTRRVKDMYMRGTIKVNKYIQKIDELNAYITIKEMEEVEEKNYLHINGNEVCNMDKGCAIIEYTPLDDNYNVRAFMNNNYEIVLYYIDMTLRNYEKNGEAYYEDLFLDLYYETPFGTGSGYYMRPDDAEELEAAYNDGIVSREECDLAWNTFTKVEQELKNRKNKFINRGIKDYVNYKIYGKV